MEGFIKLSITSNKDAQGKISSHINNVQSSFIQNKNINEVLHLLNSILIINTLDTSLYWDRGNWDSNATWQ